MGQGENLGKHRTLNGRKFTLYKRIAPKMGRYDAMSFFAASEDDPDAEDISFTFGVGKDVASEKGIKNQQEIVRFLTPLGLRHFYLLLEEAEYGSQHKIVLGFGSPASDFDPDDRAYSKKHLEFVKLDILSFLERSERNHRPQVSFTDIVKGCYALQSKLRPALNRLTETGLVNEKGSNFSISQKGLNALASMENKTNTKTPTSSSERRDFFICHASEDKEEVAKPLAEALIARDYTIWLDENDILLGDDIPENLSKGISMASFSILIMSPVFFEKYWTMKELSSFLMKEAHGSGHILPLRHGLKPEEITELYPILGSRFSHSFDEGIDKIVSAIEVAFHKKKET